MTSNSKFIGYLVSIESKNVFYQGIINQIDAEKAIIQLKNCFQNGLNLGSKLIDVKTTEIDNIEILADPLNAVNLLKPTTAQPEPTVQQQQNDTTNTTNKPVKQISPQQRAPHNIKRNNSYYQNGYNEENCFNSMNEDFLKDDFDFEKNLALFDKNAFYEQIEGHSKPTPTPAVPSSTKSQAPEINSKYHQISLDNLFSSVSKQQQSQQNTSNVSMNNSNKNYRFDEMILDTGEPINYNQIQLPKKYSNKNYVTDDGFVVPCIDYKLREQLIEQSYKFGFNKQRQIECMGRCCTEMCLQLLGGCIRFLPKNSHQKPSILILANSNSIQGIYALCAARLLSIRTVKIYLLVFKCNEEDDDFKNELNFFKSNNDPSSIVILNNVNDLNNIKSIDLIINGLESFNDSANLIVNKNLKAGSWLNALNRYIENCKASVLSIDPPSAKQTCTIKSKWCITPILPMEMSENSGRVYLCDFGFTKQIFQSVNIKYQSPFGAKFVIPLHND